MKHNIANGNSTYMFVAFEHRYLSEIKSDTRSDRQQCSEADDEKQRAFIVLHSGRYGLFLEHGILIGLVGVTL